MGLLDGGLQAVFGAAFGPMFLDGTLHTMTETPDGQGGYTSVNADVPIKVMVETYSQQYRQRNSIPVNDVRLIVLQLGTGSAIPEITLSSEITVNGIQGNPSIRYTLHDREQDPARAAWTLQGRPKDGIAG